MIRRSLFALIFLFNTHLAYGESSITNQDINATRHLVQKFQQVPVEHMFCSKTRREHADDPEGAILRQFTNFFSGEMLKLFAWIQCERPKQPRPLFNERIQHWDLRYGFSMLDSGYGESPAANVRVLVGQVQANKRILVKVLFDTDSPTPLHTIYTLIREDNQWKIDDIALKGRSTEMEEILPSSKSLKTELQAAYKRAEAKYQKDQRALKKK